MRRLQGVNGMHSLMACLFNPSHTHTETSSAATPGQRLGPVELSEGVRSADIERLKTNATKCLTDTFFKKILDVEEVCACAS